MENTQIYSIPDTYVKRSNLRKIIDSFMSSHAYTPPLSLENLNDISDMLIEENTLDPSVKGWMMVEINNCVWKETIASIPYEKRMLLLPKCISNSTKCRAEFDEYGLLCHRCNNCSIPDLQDKADSLGVMSIVAEGFTSVVGLIQNHVIDTVIGVGCLDSLEKTFPLLIDNAVPGLAIPLNKSGCKDTTVDYAYVEEMLSMRTDKDFEPLDYDLLKANSQDWFTKENLERILPPAKDHTSKVAREWLCGDGKRWRPYLLAAVYQSLTGNSEIPENIKLAAIAVECFHKASLVHDDIQDNDTERYGKQTVNALYGDAIAINVGDVLLGEGYLLLTKCGSMELVKVASEGHISLCKGQGMELEWSSKPRPFTMDFVLDIFCNKTVPAFDIALIMGIICADGDVKLYDIIHNYSRSLGIAYQLLDDIEDFQTDEPVAIRPSAVLARVCELSDDHVFIERLFTSDNMKEFFVKAGKNDLLNQAVEDVKQMAEQYRIASLDALDGLTNIELKRLLFRVTKRILK